MADNVTKGGNSRKGNISKDTRCSYNVNCKIRVIKHAEKTTMKEEENTLSLRQMSKGGNNRNRNFTMLILH
jgi:hypothetical protein